MVDETVLLADRTVVVADCTRSNQQNIDLFHVDNLIHYNCTNHNVLPD